VENLDISLLLVVSQKVMPDVYVFSAAVFNRIVAEPLELFQLKCLSHASGAITHLNRNNPSVPQI
jgi:hypothetical protein